MKFYLPVLVGLGWLFAAPIVLNAKIERTVEKSFTVQPGGMLKVETDGGGIRVEAAAGDTVKIVIHQRFDASTDAEADEMLKHLTLTLEQQGNDVTAVAKYEGDRTSSWFHWGSWPPVQCEFRVTVPATYNVDLKTSGGGITVGNLAGKVQAHTSGGGLEFGRITGTIDGHTSGGGISVESCTGDVKVHTSGGGIHLGPVGGNAEVHTSGGGITIKEIAGVVNAHTSGGPIEASFSGPLKGDCELSTSGGGITVYVDPKSDFDLDARTSGGGVSCKLPITVVGEVKPGHLSGKVNAGGHELKLRSSGGGIHIGTN
jgi:Putative adhesin